MTVKSPYIVKRMLVVAVVSASVGFGQARLDDSGLHALILQGIDLSWKQSFTASDSVFRTVCREFPNHPAGYVLRAGLALAYAEDHETLLNVVPFDSLLDIGRRKARALVLDPSQAKWGHHFLGTADGTDSYARVYRGDWVGGILRGLSSVSSFEKAVTLDSGMVDSYAGIGAFNYWRSKKTEIVNWLPFIGDARAQAIEMLNKTAHHGVYNRMTALSMLTAIHTDAGNFQEAVNCARAGLREYPSNRTFLWALATACDRMNAPQGATQAYSSLLGSLEQDPAENSYNIFVATLNLADALAHCGDVRQSRIHLNRVLRTDPATFAEHLRKRAKNNLERAQQLEKRLNAAASESR